MMTKEVTFECTDEVKRRWGDFADFLIMADAPAVLGGGAFDKVEVLQDGLVLHRGDKLVDLAFPNLEGDDMHIAFVRAKNDLHRSFRRFAS